MHTLIGQKSYALSYLIYLSLHITDVLPVFENNREVSVIKCLHFSRILKCLSCFIAVEYTAKASSFVKLSQKY